jgi:hypothetical protein
MPDWITWLLVVLFAVTSLPCVIQLAVRSPTWQEDGSHLAMAVGMIAMLTPLRHWVPQPLWFLVFGGQAVLFARRLLVVGHGGRPWQGVHHLMAGLAMVYMGLMAGRPMAGAGQPMSGLAALGIAFGMYFLAYASWTAIDVVRRPRVTEGCHALLAGGMAWVLIASL